MVFKKSGKQIFGVAFTEKEEQALQDEIERRIEENLPDYIRGMESNIDAQMLWYLHEHEGHGKKRLLKDYEDFPANMQALIDHYEMKEDDASFTAKIKLRELGVDVDKLREEKSHDQLQKLPD